MPHAESMAFPPPQSDQNQSHARFGTASFPRPVPSPRAVLKFKALYQEHFGEELQDEVAFNLATRYLQFFFFGVTPFERSYKSLHQPLTPQ